MYATTRAEAEAKVRDLLVREESGRPVAPAALTLEAFLREWLAQIVAERVRPNTLNAYRYNAERYLIPDLGKKRLARLSARELRGYLGALRTRGVGDRTVRYVHATLRAALEDAVREEILDRNVAKLVRVPRPQRREHEPLSVAEVRTLLKSTRDDRCTPCTS